MENKNNETKPNLISRLFARYHDSKIVKGIAGITISTAMILSMTACDPETFLPTGPGTENGTHQTEGNQNNTTDNSTDNTTDNTEDQTSKPDISQYSELLQYVLTDDYYSTVLTSLYNGNINNKSAILGKRWRISFKYCLYLIDQL